MAIFTWKLSFNCISLIFKSEKVGLQPCRTFQLSLSFPVFAVCKMFVRDSKAEQNKPHEIPDSVFGLFQSKTFPHPKFVQPPAAALQGRSHPTLMPFLIPAPLLAAARTTQKQKGSSGYFSLTPVSNIWFIVLKNLLGLLGYDLLFLPAKEKDAGVSLTSYQTQFPRSLEIQLLFVQCLLSSTYDLDWWPLDVLDEGLYRSRRRKEEKQSWKLRHSSRSHPKAATRMQWWMEQGHVRGQEGAAPRGHQGQPPPREGGMQRQNTKYSK